MRKILVIILASLFSFSVANAGSFGIGAKAGLVTIDASGTEADKDGTADTSTRTAEVDNTVIIPSLFAEYGFENPSFANEGNGITFGIEYTPGSADVSDDVLTRTDATSDSNEAVQDDGDRSAQASVENYMNYYLELPLFSSLYVRGGIAQIDVNTEESSTITTAGSYGNTSLDGTNLGIGFKGVSDGGYVWKFAYEQIDFDTLSLNSSTSDKGNKITADLDTKEFNISIGKRF